MKVTNVVNSQNLNAHSASNRKTASKSVLTVDNNRRFDTFTMTGTAEKAEGSDEVKKLDAKTTELVRSLSMLSAEDKVEFAFDSYLSMQKALLHIKETVEFQAECFTDLSDKKAYYTDLLNSGFTVGEGGGKYKFSGCRQGDSISPEDVHNALDKVQKCLDSFCRETSDEEIAAMPLPEHVTGYLTYKNVYFGDERMFKTGAAGFSAATGISNSALELGSGELYFSKEGINEENFLEKANSLLNAISDRSKRLGDIWAEYSYNQRHLTDKLKERLESAEKAEAEKDISIADMIKQYDEYLNKAFDKFKVITQKE